MRTEREIEAELKATERDKAVARYCEVIGDYGLPIPTDFHGPNIRADNGRLSSGVFGGK